MKIASQLIAVDFQGSLGSLLSSWLLSVITRMQSTKASPIHRDIRCINQRCLKSQSLINFVIGSAYH